jgi:predicted GIY-YIG superfamily endonuclease
MGLKLELDKIAVRYIYYLVDNNNEVLYVGTTKNVKQRYKNHLNKIAKKNNALIYRYCNKHNIIPKLKIVNSLYSTYNDAEKIEIQHIIKHSNTCLNFYNNPNKERYNLINENTI